MATPGCFRQKMRSGSGRESVNRARMRWGECQTRRYNLRYTVRGERRRRGRTVLGHGSLSVAGARRGRGRGAHCAAAKSKVCSRLSVVPCGSHFVPPASHDLRLAVCVHHAAREEDQGLLRGHRHAPDPRGVARARPARRYDHPQGRGCVLSHGEGLGCHFGPHARRAPHERALRHLPAAVQRR